MTTRTPFWISPEELELLNAITVKEYEFNRTEELESLCAEFSVAKTRMDNTRVKRNKLAAVLGLDKKMLPVRLSEREKELLLQFDMPKELKERLA